MKLQIKIPTGSTMLLQFARKTEYNTAYKHTLQTSQEALVFMSTDKGEEIDSAII